MILVNGKYLSQQLTGVQRYAQEIVTVWEKNKYPFHILKPKSSLIGRVNINVWEQILPYYSRMKNKPILWCPTNTGPLRYKNQVLTVHDGAVLVHPEWFSKKYVAWRTRVLPYLLKNSLLIITVSEFSKKNLCTYGNVNPNKIHCVYNGINLDFFKKNKLKIDIKQKYHIKRNYFLVLGSIEPRKNITRILDAWIMLPNFIKKEYELLIVGNKSNIFKQQNLRLPDNVRLLGYIPDVDLPALYSEAIAFVYPSLFEGFGLPILEAMACHTPVITSNITALPEVGGDAVIYVDPYDSESIANGMQQLVEDSNLRLKLIEKGIVHIQKFSWDKSAKKIWKILEKVKY